MPFLKKNSNKESKAMGANIIGKPYDAQHNFHANVEKRTGNIKGTSGNIEGRWFNCKSNDNINATVADFNNSSDDMEIGHPFEVELTCHVGYGTSECGLPPKSELILNGNYQRSNTEAVIILMEGIGQVIKTDTINTDLKEHTVVPWSVATEKQNQQKQAMTGNRSGSQSYEKPKYGTQYNVQGIRGYASKTRVCGNQSGSYGTQSEKYANACGGYDQPIRECGNQFSIVYDNQFRNNNSRPSKYANQDIGYCNQSRGYDNKYSAYGYNGEVGQGAFKSDYSSTSRKSVFLGNQCVFSGNQTCDAMKYRGEKSNDDMDGNHGGRKVGFRDHYGVGRGEMMGITVKGEDSLNGEGDSWGVNDMNYRELGVNGAERGENRNCWRGAKDTDQNDAIERGDRRDLTKEVLSDRDGVREVCVRRDECFKPQTGWTRSYNKHQHAGFNKRTVSEEYDDTPETLDKRWSKPGTSDKQLRQYIVKQKHEFEYKQPYNRESPAPQNKEEGKFDVVPYIQAHLEEFCTMNPEAREVAEKGFRKKIQPSFCDLCNAKMNDEIHARLHYKGKNHGKKVQKFFKACATNNATKVTEDLEKTNEERKEKQKAYEKETQLSLAEQQENEHFNRINHPKRKQVATRTDPAIVCKSFCEMCNVQVTSQEMLDHHYNGVSHKLRSSNITKTGIDVVLDGGNSVDDRYKLRPGKTAKYCTQRPSKYKKATDDTLDQTLTNSLAEHMKSVGALIFRNGIGTVFRVGSKYVMTAWHVVKAIIDPWNTGFDFSRLEEDSVFINFNEDPKQPSTIIYRVKKHLAFKDEHLDVAVLEIKNTVGLPQPFFLCTEGTIETMGISNVSFIGYGHPNSQRKTLDPRCSIIKPSSKVISEAYAWLDEKKTTVVNSGYQEISDESKLTFSCFLENGASGSPAIATKDSKVLKVVGVLTHGIPDFYFELPEDAKSEFPHEWRFEMGSRMTYIYKAIYNNNAKLAQDLFGSRS